MTTPTATAQRIAEKLIDYLVGDDSELGETDRAECLTLIAAELAPMEQEINQLKADVSREISVCDLACVEASALRAANAALRLRVAELEARSIAVTHRRRDVATDMNLILLGAFDKLRLFKLGQIEHGRVLFVSAVRERGAEPILAVVARSFSRRKRSALGIQVPERFSWLTMALAPLQNPWPIPKEKLHTVQLYSCMPLHTVQS